MDAVAPRGPGEGRVVAVYRFTTAEGAGEALAALDVAALGVCDAAVVRWPPGRRGPVVRRPGRVVGDAALGGACWGLLAGLAVAAPLVGAAVGAGVGALAAWTTREAIAGAVIRAACRCAVPGTSVLVLLSRTTVDDVLRSTGAAPVSTGGRQ